MKTNVIKSELNFENLNSNFCPLVHLLKLEICPDCPQDPKDYQQGMLDYATPYIQEILTKTNLADYTQLISISTGEQDYEGTHIWTFALNCPDLMDYEPSLIDTIKDSLMECFPYDPEACLSHVPQVHYMNGLFIVLDPYTC